MSFWDSFSDTAGEIWENAQEDIVQAAGDYFKKQLNTQPAAPVQPASQLPTPFATGVTNTANFVQANGFYLLLGFVGLLTVLLFRKGR